MSDLRAERYDECWPDTDGTYGIVFDGDGVRGGGSTLGLIWFETEAQALAAIAHVNREPLLNPQPTMRGDQLAEAIDAGKPLEVLRFGEWSAPNLHPTAIAAYRSTLAGHEFVARLRIVEPEPEPESEDEVPVMSEHMAEHTVALRRWLAMENVEGPDVYEELGYWRRFLGDDVIEAAPTPPAESLPPGVPETKRIGLVEEAGGGWVRVLVDRDLDQYPDVGAEVLIEVRPVPEPETELVPLHKLIGRTVGGFGEVHSFHVDEPGKAEVANHDIGTERVPVTDAGMVRVLTSEPQR